MIQRVEGGGGEQCADSGDGEKLGEVVLHE